MENKKTLTNSALVVMACVLLAHLAAPAAAVTHYVSPGQSIQASIDDANDADEIEVAPGTYNEAINFNGKAIRLYSTAGPEVTVIDANGLDASVVTCSTGEGPDTILEGFTITGAIGGGMYSKYTSPTVIHCTFNGNSADYDGGGMFNWSSSPTVTNCTFTGNSADNGGGMYNSYHSSPTVTDCTFTENSATSYGGGMCNWDYSSPTVTNCTFSGNSADGWGGGGMYNLGSSPTVTNCTFSGNSADDYGGGMYSSYYSNPTVTNSILWGDAASHGNEIVLGSDSSININYCDVMGGRSGIYNPGSCTIGWGWGNIDAPPLFVDASAGDLRLSSTASPCVDAGDNTAPALPATDLAANPRVVDGERDGTPTVDMGAYEFHSPPIYNITQDRWYDSMQGSIDDANDGDQIEIGPATYNEAINFNGKAVHLYSSHGPEETIIDGTANVHVVQCVSGEGLDTILEGFTITGGCANGLTDTDRSGGGMLNDASSPTVVRCIFTGNSGNLYAGGMFNNNSLPTVTNCLFYNNTAQNSNGGAIANYNSSHCNITNCTFYNNSAPNGTGAGIWNYQSNPTVTNTILWQNVPDQISSEASSPVVSYSDVQGGHSGTGNIDADPLFINGPGGHLRLSLGVSPCIDTGDNNALAATTDLAGNPRLVDGDDNGTTIVDMGAYEFQARIQNVTSQRWYDFIQPAIDDANDGDQIEIGPATYNEAINFNGKAVRLYSSHGPELTIIDATGIAGAYHVVQCITGEDPNTILQGFTITGGIAPEYPDYRGGGMYNYRSSPTVTNCRFSGNCADHIGGGMCNLWASNPTVTNCTFSGNTADAGGGMHNSYSSPTVKNCTFSGNSAEYAAGGMANYECSSPTVTNCTFSRNWAGNYGGGMYNDESSPTVTNCTFTGNSASDHGGGMCNSYGSPTVTNCTFSGNCADNYGGGMYNYEYSSPTVTNCTFNGNSASYDGGGMYNDDSNPTLINSILWDDTPDEIYNHECTPTVTYSDVQGGYTGTGNIDADPCFVDVSNPDPNLWNLRLQPDSPCIDAADSNSVPGDTADLDGDGDTAEPIPLDLNGFPRSIDDICTPDTGNPAAPLVDMGAYEFLRSDIDSSGDVTFKDFSKLALYWLDAACGPCGGADLTCDGNVDLNDLHALADWWLAGI